jgi:CDP-diacylglycerol--serine O-phosphatidyltransferase
VPALLLYMWDLKNLGSWGWFAVLVYIMATALRLARFNVMNALQAEMPQPPKAYFLGVPAPMGALLAILPLFLDLSQFLEGRDLTVFSAIYLIFIAFLMISKLKTISLKAIRFNNKFALPAIFCFAILVALLITKTWEAIVFIDVAYLCYIAFAFYRSIMRSRRRV